jgi:mono/diheme cytochrome c family protein
MLAGCGGGSGGAPAASTDTVTGVAAAGLPLVGTAFLKDSSSPAKELSMPIGAGGSFSFDVTGMKGPFILQAVGTANGTNYMFNSFAGAPGTANINPMSNVAVATAGEVTDPSQIFTTPDPAMLQKVAAALPTALSTLKTQLMPLLNLYGAAAVDPIAGNYIANGTGLDAMFDAVNIGLSAGVMTVMNRTTSAMIYSAPVNNITSGTMTMGNMPVVSPPPAPTPVPINGVALYAAECAGCHGPLATSDKLGATTAMIQTGIGNLPAMSSLSSLTPAEIQAIAAALAPVPVPVPTPAPAPTPPPALTWATYNTYCSGCHGTAKHGKTAAQTQAAITANRGGMGSLKTLSAATIAAIAAGQ